jgi:hypothetical protein
LEVPNSLDDKDINKYLKSKMKEEQSPRKLAIIKDPECKMRVIAMFDGLSQTLLESLSKHLFQILEKIPSDRTFNQDPRFYHTKIDKNQKLYSLDLSSATDRFPVSVQVQILSKLIGEQKANAWKMLMVGQEFTTPDGESTINYIVGQPMGAKSS